MHIENFWFVLLFGLIGLIRTLLSRAEESRKRNSANTRRVSPPPPAAPEPDSDTERMRKFLEALGQPANAPPPPKVKPRVDAPKVATELKRRLVETHETMTRRASNPLPPLVTRPPIEPRRVEPSIHRPPVVVREPLSRSSVEILAAEAYEAQKGASARLDDSLGQLLGSPNALRNAIILREIFGPPRALQPL